MTKQDKVIEYINYLKKNNKIKNGEFIPSERQLIIKLQVSRNTVRSALHKLKEAEILISIKGKGYVYNKHKGLSLKNFKEQYGKSHRTIFIKERFIEQLEPTIKVNGFWEIIKIRYKNDRPFIMTYQRISSYMKKKIKPSYKESLYNALTESGFKISYAKKFISYVSTPEEVKHFLPKIGKNTLLLFSVTKDINNSILEISYNYYYPKKFKWTWVEKTY